MAIINMTNTSAGSAGPLADFSGHLDDVIRAGDVAHFPSRAEPYRLDRTIFVEGAKPQVICETGATLQGRSDRPIFHSVAAGQRMRLTGGRWTGGKNLLVHSCPSALQLVRVEGAEIFDFDVAFDFPTQIIACVWRDCTFAECGIGVRFGGVANIHTVSDCTFVGCGVGLRMEIQLDNRLQLAVERCRFTGNQAGVVVDGAAQQALAIRDCHFSSNGDTDVLLQLLSGGNWIGHRRRRALHLRSTECLADGENTFGGAGLVPRRGVPSHGRSPQPCVCRHQRPPHSSTRRGSTGTACRSRAALTTTRRCA